MLYSLSRLYLEYIVFFLSSTALVRVVATSYSSSIGRVQLISPVNLDLGYAGAINPFHLSELWTSCGHDWFDKKSGLVPYYSQYFRHDTRQSIIH